ncbi:MAG: glycosyltransferase family 4 protein [Nitrosarchaeum sp.]|nr:glycosyltransferase family 4 protein [Nitrosarchaeum sp.]
MRIGLVMDYGHLAKAISLNHIAEKLFFEMGKIMNETKDFTIAATTINNVGFADVNQHFDIIAVPNMGGYRFPFDSLTSSKNLIIQLVGIDEVILGREVFLSDAHYAYNKPIIEGEVKKWKENHDKIKMIHVATEPEKDQMVKYLNLPDEKLVVIPLGIDHDIFKPTEDRLQTRKNILNKFSLNDNPYYIHICEYNWARKNIPRMLEAFKQARNEGIKENLIIIGPQRDNYLTKAVKKIDGVYFLGYVKFEELVQLVQCSNALLFPSLHEGFGFPLVEAMACKVPVITSNTFSPPWTAKGGGLFVNPYDVSDIKNKILEMSQNSQLRASLAEQAYERSLFFSWDKMAKQLLDLYKRHCKPKVNENYDENYDMAAYRTLVTMVEKIPELTSKFIFDILKFDYSGIIAWSIEHGFEHPETKYFLLPFKEWLHAHST